MDMKKSILSLQMICLNVTYNLRVFIYNLENIIPIRAWNGLETKDDSLLKMKNIIKSYSSNLEVCDIVNSSINNDV